VQAVVAHFASKPAFARWDPEMLADYAETGTRQRGHQRVLAFEREVEARIYATLPHRLGRLLRHPSAVPVGFIGGTASRELRMAGMAATRHLVGPHLRWIEGGSHLFPFEQPEATATAILAMVQEFIA
jgi:pimeloyl-ACP methyl ester carboxylesterase